MVFDFKNKKVWFRMSWEKRKEKAIQLGENRVETN